MLYNFTFLLLSGGDICYFPVIQLVNFLEEAPVQYSHYTYYLYLREKKKEQRAKKKNAQWNILRSVSYHLIYDFLSFSRWNTSNSILQQKISTVSF